MEEDYKKWPEPLRKAMIGLRKASGCGANADGGGGFQKGNTCGAANTKGGKKPNVKDWAGESVIVDDKGKPLTLYHGSYKQFDELQSSDRRRAIYATPSKEAAGLYGDFIHQVHMRAKNPVYVLAKDTSMSDLTDETGKVVHDAAIGFHWIWESDGAQQLHPHWGTPIGSPGFTRKDAVEQGRFVDKEGRAWFEVMVPDAENVMVSGVSGPKE